ncbi:LysR substrate-binding domain-containing protein [uncultured Cohaesibacter sp.]|uniref:LysR substrate-binding domain-containing protein n=1 Tax=uncultured Cohaesibacter sp. TaxID=1002546 RepID=UPI0029C770CC|nr:LysR substrate-binding domain-containing protein [uncultured Cohaesibacter sp.]
MQKTNLDLAALRTFVVGIETGSFAAAADRLGRSTSAASAQLKKLESQIGKPLTKKTGRHLSLTESGEQLLSYGRRLLALNDEAISALQEPELEGWIRLGLQEDFGERLLPDVLGQFARAHPKVRIEGRIARNRELRDKIASGQLDLALCWDDGSPPPTSEKLADVPLCWLGSRDSIALESRENNSPLPLLALEAPCLFRSIACDSLDQHDIAWRIAFVSPSLAGLWAASHAGLGIALRSKIGCPDTVQRLDPEDFNLPPLPTVGLVLHHASEQQTPVIRHFSQILKRSLQDILTSL